MKKKLFTLFYFLISFNFCFSQNSDFKIVFDITTGDTATHARVIRWVKGIADSYTDAKVEIVFYGKSLDMLLKDKSTVSADVIKLATEKNVTFAACEHAMMIFNIRKEQLLPGVTTVQDALYELVTKQAEGYGYIKVVN